MKDMFSQGRYLMRKWKKGSIAHLWDGQDTWCRMYSTGGLAEHNYVLSDDLGDKKICDMCRLAGK